MRAREPGLGDQRRARFCRHSSSSRAKLAGEQGREGLRRDLRRRATRLGGPGSSGAAARLTPKPTTTRSPLRSSRMPASFLPQQQQVVGPFEHQRLRREPRRRSLRSAPGRRPATALRRADRRRAARPACCRRNCPARTPTSRPWRPLPASCSSATSQSPSTALSSAIRSALVEPVRSTIRMRRQKSDPAARSVSAPSGPISR